MSQHSPTQDTTTTPTPDPVESAKAAGLLYVSDRRPGLRREPDGEDFRYLDKDGQPVTDEETLRRIKALAIPPAWTDVWICLNPRGHLQATGRDARGRKQYRYHPRWRQVRDENKYDRMMAFGRALPQIRAQVETDLARSGLPREKVLATVVRLLETTLIRVGNEEYARTNRSFGLTTMRTRHVSVNGAKLEFKFRGKSGIKHNVDVTDRRVASIVKRCQSLPGQELFQYLDDEGQPQTINSEDVNDYLQAITGQDFTAKDFRTWAGTVLAAVALQEFESFDSAVQAKKNVVQAIESVAIRLGNTPSICRKCYVHPAIIESYVDGTMAETLKQRAEQELGDSLQELPPEEAAVLALLQQRLSQEAESPAPGRRGGTQ
jgi:DNA topoisomerase-1